MKFSIQKFYACSRYEAFIIKGISEKNKLIKSMFSLKGNSFLCCLRFQQWKSFSRRWSYCNWMLGLFVCLFYFLEGDHERELVRLITLWIFSLASNNLCCLPTLWKDLYSFRSGNKLFPKSYLTTMTIALVNIYFRYHSPMIWMILERRIFLIIKNAWFLWKKI